MVHELQEGKGAEPGWWVVEEAVTVGGNIPGADFAHPERFNVDGVVRGEVEGCWVVSN